jgi:hypothetical protein
MLHRLAVHFVEGLLMLSAVQVLLQDTLAIQQVTGNVFKVMAIKILIVIAKFQEIQVHLQNAVMVLIRDIVLINTRVMPAKMDNML